MSYNMKITLIAILVALFGNAITNAAEVTKVDNNVYITGNIEVLDYAKVVNLVDYNDNVILKSNGGLTYTALAMGYHLNKLNVKTIVNEERYSACGLLFFAGKHQELNGTIGIHCTHIKKVCLDKDHEANKSIRFYLNEVNPKVTKLYFKYADKLTLTIFRK